MDAPAPTSSAPVTPVTTDDLSAPAPVRRGVQLPAWLAVLIVLIVAGGFGYLGWRMLKPPPPTDLSQYDSNDVGGRRRWANVGKGGQPFIRPAPVPPRPVEGVTIEASGSGVVRTPTLSISFLVSGTKTNLVANPIGGSPIAPEDRTAVRARATAIDNADARKAVGVTDEQAAKLRAIVVRNPPPLDAAGRTKLLGLWASYRAADAGAKPAAEKAVMDAVREMATAHTAARMANSHATADQIRAVLNADQVNQLAARR